jgi:hypothetical protein
MGLGGYGYGRDDFVPVFGGDGGYGHGSLRGMSARFGDFASETQGLLLWFKEQVGVSGRGATAEGTVTHETP